MANLSLSEFSCNGQTITKRADGFINLTQMCQANGKRLDNWARLKQTQEYISVLRNSLQCEVVCTEEGASGGTWGHPSLAINLARWINADFAVWCDSHIFQLMSTGSTSISNQPTLPQSYLEALKALVASEEEKELLKTQNVILEEQNYHLSEALDELFDYSSIIRIAKFNKVSESKFSWHRLKAVSQQMGYEIKKVPCPRFETKNLYSHDVWRVAYPEISLPETTTLVISR